LFDRRENARSFVGHSFREKAFGADPNKAYFGVADEQPAELLRCRRSPSLTEFFRMARRSLKTERGRRDTPQ
jgi:hypothetical protein